MRIHYLFLCLLSELSLYAQNPATNTLSANRINATVLNDGRLFTDGQTGRFLAPYVPGGNTSSLLKGTGLWLGGLDAGGNLKLAVATPEASDFSPGRPSPDGANLAERLGNKIWRVTRADIDAHRADFADNGQIDQPVAAVFAWPGNGNPFFSQYNGGVNLTFSPYGLAGFYDADLDGTYNPAQGDFPSIELRGCPGDHYPDEMLWWVFHDRRTQPHPVSKSPALDVEVQVTAFAYNCQENSALGNTVFTRFKLINLGNENLEETYFALYNDYNIGDGTQEYAGCNPGRQMVFAYPGNPSQGYFPALAVDFMRGPLAEQPAGFGELQLHSAVPFDPAQLLSPAVFFNLMKGLNPDGAPAANNGLPYPDNPLAPNGQSELTAGNTPGNRAAVAAYGPFQLQPGAVNELFTAHLFADNSGLDAAVSNVQPLYKQSDLLQGFFDNCFAEPAPASLCQKVFTNTSGAPATALRCFPNPAKGSFDIEDQAAGIHRATIYNLQGQPLLDQRWPGAPAAVSIQVAQWAPAVYVVRVENGAGQVATRKVTLIE